MNSIMSVFTPVEWAIIVLVLVCMVWFGPFVLGAVLIQERQVGVVVKEARNPGGAG